MQRKDKGIVGHDELGIAARVGGGDKDPVPHLQAAHVTAQLLHDTSSICNKAEHNSQSSSNVEF